MEASELLEVFRWKSHDEVIRLLESPSRERVADEIAGITILLSYLCHDIGIDVNSAVMSKLKKNEAKCPVEKSYGNAKKYMHDEAIAVRDWQCINHHKRDFGGNDPYNALKTTLKAEFAPEAWATLNSDTAGPFDRPKSGLIAVKEIYHLGDEVLKVFKV